MSLGVVRAVAVMMVAVPAASAIYLYGTSESVEWFSTYRPLLLSWFSYYGMMALAFTGLARLVTLGNTMVKETDLGFYAVVHALLLLLSFLISWFQTGCTLSPFWGCLNTLYITGKT